MKLFFRLFGIWLLLGCVPVVFAQISGPKIDRVDIKFVGPSSISEQFIRANIRVKVDQADDGGVVLSFIVQARPRITEIKLEGNKKLTDSKLKKKITVKVGEPLDEQKLFTDVQEMKKLYEKYGYADTKVKYVLNIDEATGHGTVTFHIDEAPKVKITEVDFIGAQAFT